MRWCERLLFALFLSVCSFVNFSAPFFMMLFFSAVVASSFVFLRCLACPWLIVPHGVPSMVLTLMSSSFICKG